VSTFWPTSCQADTAAPLFDCEKCRDLGFKAGWVKYDFAFAQDASFDRARLAAPVMDHDAAIGV